MAKPSFVYVSYISTTPEKVWQALVDASVMRKYWADPTDDDSAHENVSGWKPGSKWEHRRADDTGAVDIVGKVVQILPPRRSWSLKNFCRVERNNHARRSERAYSSNGRP